MVFDQISLLAAIGFSSAALSATLCLAWISSRRDNFLLSWAGGLAILVGGVILFSALGKSYQSEVQFISFVLLISGFAFVYAGAMQFRIGSAKWSKVVLGAAAGIIPSAGAYSFGLSGLGTTLGNTGIAILLGLTAHQYWLGRKDAPVPMVANAFLYAINAVSFLLCGLVLLLDGQLVLTTRPENWAEDVNAIVLIIGITGIGALSLAMNQSRIAGRHRMDAMTDPLTGLLNRRALMEQFETTPVQPGTAVMVADLDHFKAINDRFGHGVGDLVLTRFAAIVRDSIGRGGIVARMGGEEFCVVLTNTTATAAHRVAERIRTALEAEVMADQNGTVVVTASIGLVMCAGEPESLSRALDRADAALYDAKWAGRNQVRAVGGQMVVQNSLEAAPAAGFIRSPAFVR